MGPELVRDRLSRGTNLLGTNYGGPNVRGPYAFGTKCVAASPQFRCPWLWVNDGGIQTYVLRTYMGFHHQASKVTISFEDQSVHPSLRFQRICNKSLWTISPINDVGNYLGIYDLLAAFHQFKQKKKTHYGRYDLRGRSQTTLTEQGI